MLAAVLYGKEDVRVEQVPAAPLKPGEVRVGIQAALTCGTDLKVYKRGYHARMIIPPSVFGHELAGNVIEVHPATKGWKAGERVGLANSAPCGQCFHCQQDQENLCDDLLFINGAYAESIVIPARLAQKNLLRLKPETSFADAALTEPLACVVQGVDDLLVKPGERVLVLGAGPIGLMFTALLHHRGCRVTVAGRGETRLRTAEQLGADECVQIRDTARTVAEVKAQSSTPFDVVVEAVGKPETWEASVVLARKGGRVNLFGGCPAGTKVSFDTGLIHYSNLTLLASFHHRPSTIREALDYIEAGVIKAGHFVTGECTLEQLPELFKSMTLGNRAVKTLITISGA